MANKQKIVRNAALSNLVEKRDAEKEIAEYRRRTLGEIATISREIRELEDETVRISDYVEKQEERLNLCILLPHQQYGMGYEN